MRREVVYLSDPLRMTCAILNCLPIPGVGAIIVGIRNPHSPYLRHGILQLILVVFGAWPLVVPGIIGLAWAIWDAIQIGTKGRPAPRWSKPTANAPPESVLPDPAIARAERDHEKQRKRDATRKAAALRQQQRQAARAQAKQGRAIKREAVKQAREQAAHARDAQRVRKERTRPRRPRHK